MIALSGLLSNRGLALDPELSILQYNCRTWSRQNGLPVNGINAITQGADGYIWLGTAVGLVRFDGIEFRILDLGRVSELRSSIVSSLAPARDGGLWVGLENGAFGFYDESGFTFRGRDAWGRVNMNVRSLLETSEGSLWIAAERQAVRLTRDGDYIELAGTVNDIAPNFLRVFEDSRGRVWFGTVGKGVSYWEAGTFSPLADPAAGTVLSIAEDRAGRIWLGSEKGLTCVSADLQPVESIPLPEAVRALLVDRHGVLWVGTEGEGLLRYHQGTFTYLRKADGLAGDFITTLHEDREGSLWIGTREGVSQLTDVKFPTHAMSGDRGPNDVGAVTPSRRGGVWVGSVNGVTYFDGTSRTYSTEAGVPPGSVKRVFEAGNGDVYFVSGLTTLGILSGEKVVALHAAPNLVVGMAEDAHGVVVSVGGNLYRASIDGLTPFVFTQEAPGFIWILNLTSGRDGAIWVASEAGIFRVKDGAYSQWTGEKDFIDPRVQMICEDQEGVVWAALFTGIVRLKDNRIHRISRKDGLLDDNICAIVPDDLGNLWVDSGRGVFQVSRQTMNDFADGRIDRVECVAYDGQESVRSVDKSVMQERVGCRSLDGRVWFPSGRGVVAIDPARIPTNQIPPPVRIDLIRANGAELVRSESMVVSPGRGELDIHFTGLSLIAPEKMRFRYQLIGYDPDWVEAGDRRQAFYTNLRPGPYTFRVLAANADGVWNHDGDAASIELLPHFRQTIGFKVVCVALALAVVIAVSAWRLQHLKRRQRALHEARIRLESEVSIRTAELAAANVSLQHEAEGHKRAEAQLKLRTQALEIEIEERARMQQEVDRIHRELLEVSRRAGMAEVATSVLHNVGNVLNSVNVSATLVAERVSQSESAQLGRICTLLRQHESALGPFFQSDPKGRQVLGFLENLAAHLASEQANVGTEVTSLRKNVDHIKEIVARQQSYATISGVAENIAVTELVEDALRMNDGALARHEIRLVRDFQASPAITVEKHKVLQILVNLLRNAKFACGDCGRPDKEITVRVSADAGGVRIAVVDNGVGIPPGNLTRIFSHGFTTRKTGHGFGLHSGALAAREMGGSLRVESAGAGRGATFILELPMQPHEVVAGHVHHAADHA